MSERSFSGEKIGAHVLGQELGRGQFATVYAIEGAPHAMKLSHLFAKEKYRDLFVREGQFLEALQSPHIMPFYESGQVQIEGEEQDRLYHVVGRARYGSLEQFTETNGQLPLARAVDSIYHTALGLQDLHKGIGEGPLVHQDIKIGNILLTGETALDKKLTSWIGDLGLINSPHETDSYVGGSLSYLSPEKLCGLIGTEGDVYSLGVVAYLIFSGKMPYGRIESVNELVSIYQAHEIPDYQEHVKETVFPDHTLHGVREDLLGYVVESAMAYSPEDRPSAGNFGQQLLDTYEMAKAEHAHQRTYHEGIEVPCDESMRNTEIVKEESVDDPVQSAPDEVVVFPQKRRVTRARFALAAAAAGVMLGLAAVKGGIFPNGESELTEAKPGTVTQEKVREDDSGPGELPAETASPTLPAKKITPVEIPSIVPRSGQDEVIVYTGDITPRADESVTPNVLPSANETIEQDPTKEPKPTPSEAETSPAETPTPDESETPAPSPSPTEEPTETPLPTDPAETPAPSASPEQSGSPLILAGSQ